MSLRQRRGGEPAHGPPPFEGYSGKMPLYALGVNSRSYAVASGGGGASRTGIPNGLIFFKYNQEKIEKIGEHHTTGDAITSLDIHPEENVALYVDTDKFAKVQFAAGGTVLRTETVENNVAKNVKVLRFSPDASKVVLGCFDGALHVASYPTLTTTHSAPTAHTNDIDDVAWDPQGKLLATASKDKTAKVWKAGSVQVAHTLTCEAEGSVLIPRGCRFSPSSPTHLYVSAFIVSKASYIFVWNTENGSLIRKAKIHNNHSSSFAMNARGTYVAVGDVDGTIVVAETENLRKVLQVKPHGFFIPALAFTPPIQATTGSSTKKKGSSHVKRQNNNNNNNNNNTQEEESRGAVISVSGDYACMFTPIVHQSFVNKQLIALIVSIFVVIMAMLINFILRQ